MKKIDKEYFIKVVNESLTMRQACITLNMQFSTFKRWAEKFNCYKPNQGAKGLKKSNPNYFTENDLKDLLEGKRPSYQTYKVKQYLLRYGYKENKCDKCGITEWNGKPLNMELHHKNGISYDHRLENLEMISFEIGSSNLFFVVTCCGSQLFRAHLRINEDDTKKSLAYGQLKKNCF